MHYFPSFTMYKILLFFIYCNISFLFYSRTGLFTCQFQSVQHCAVLHMLLQTNPILPCIWPVIPVCVSNVCFVPFSSLRSLQGATMTWTASSPTLRTTCCTMKRRSSTTASLTPQPWRESTRSASAMSSPLLPTRRCTWISATETRSL